MKLAEEYILSQPEPYRSIIFNLQIIIENEIPNLELHYKWKVPFYYFRGKPFCFINVSRKRKYVDLGIVKGFQINNHQEFLISDKRTSMKSLRYCSIADINCTILKEVIQELSILY